MTTARSYTFPVVAPKQEERDCAIPVITSLSFFKVTLGSGLSEGTTVR